MRTADEIEDLLVATELPLERIDAGMWLLANEADVGERIVVCLLDSLLTFRMKVVDLPRRPAPGLLRRLLELNASSMVHGAYGVEGDAIVMVDAIEVQNVDLNEVVAVVDAFALTLADHRAELTRLLNDGAGAPAE